LPGGMALSRKTIDKIKNSSSPPKRRAVKKVSGENETKNGGEYCKKGLGVIDAPYSNLAVSTSTTTSTWCSTPPRWPRPLTCATRVSGRLERIVNV